MNQQEKALDLIKDASKLKVKIMITITLNKIKKQGPCNKGWKILLKSKPGKRKNEPFPLSDILDSNGLEDALWALRCIPEYSKLWRKYAVWCARQILHLMEDPRSINALNVAWRHSRGEIVETALDAASDAAWDAASAAALDAQTAKLRQILDAGEWVE